MVSGLKKMKLQLEHCLQANYNTASQAKSVTTRWHFFTVRLDMWIRFLII